ncbi:hypothetical protein V1264_024758 [Littorina saxatilis]|uniref:Uncharacterized protein n=1 Tax=Littorina saxatilis TaxID=31220 RepID=A0AAN9AKX1_9CAEN
MECNVFIGARIRILQPSKTNRGQGTMQDQLLQRSRYHARPTEVKVPCKTNRGQGTMQDQQRPGTMQDKQRPRYHARPTEARLPWKTNRGRGTIMEECIGRMS